MLTLKLNSLSEESNYHESIMDLLSAKDHFAQLHNPEDKMKEILNVVLPHESVESQVNDDHKSEATPNSTWRSILTGMNSIKAQCPHLYFHIIGSGTSDKKGRFKGSVRMKDDGLIYQPGDHIEWDLKER